MNNDDNDSNIFEILFWKVINNKFLFSTILKQVRYSCEDIIKFNSFDFVNNYNNYFKRIIKFKNISSFKWMIENDQIQLLLYKLKNNESIELDNCSLRIFTEVFDKKIKKYLKKTTKEAAVTVTESSPSTIFKEILVFLLNQQLVTQQNQYLTLIKAKGQTFQLVLDVFHESNVELPERIKNEIVYIFSDNYNDKTGEKLEYLLKFKRFYNVPISSPLLQAQEKAITEETTSSNKRFKQTNGDYSKVTTDEYTTNQNVKLLEFFRHDIEQLRNIGKKENQIKLCELGFFNFGDKYTLGDNIQKFIINYYKNNINNNNNNNNNITIYNENDISNTFQNYQYSDEIEELYNTSYQDIENEYRLMVKEFNQPPNYEKEILKILSIHTLKEYKYSYHSSSLSYSNYERRFQNESFLHDSLKWYSNYLLHYEEPINELSSLSKYVLEFSLANFSFKLLKWCLLNENGGDGDGCYEIKLHSFFENFLYNKKIEFTKDIDFINLYISQEKVYVKSTDEKIIKSIDMVQYEIILASASVSNRFKTLLKDKWNVQNHQTNFTQLFLNAIWKCDTEFLYRNKPSELIFDELSTTSNPQFSNEVDGSKIINLMNYLDQFVHLGNFESFFTFLTKAIILKSSEPLLLNSKQYLFQLLRHSIRGCLRSNTSILELNDENNPIISNSQEIIQYFNQLSDSSFFINNFQLKNKYLDNFISKIEILIQFYTTHNHDSSNSGSNDIFSACQSIIQSLFIELVSSSNATINQIKYIYQHISNNGITIKHQLVYSFCYLAKKSPISIIYLMKRLEKCNRYQNEGFNNYIDVDVFTFDWIFGTSSLPPKSDEELIFKLMDLSTKIIVTPNYENDNNNLTSGFQISNYSELLNFKFEFLLSSSRVDLFFKLLESLQQQLNDNKIKFDGKDSLSSFPNKVENNQTDLANQYEAEIKTRLRQFVFKVYKERSDWESHCGGSAYDLYEIWESIMETPTESLLKDSYWFFESEYSCWAITSPKVVYDLFDKPYYKLKDQSLHPQKHQITNHEEKDTCFLKLHFQFKELDEIESKHNNRNSKINSKNCQEEYSFYHNCNNFSEIKECSCKNDLNEIIDGRIFYFSIKVYHNAIKVMNEYEFIKFIKFCSYHSFIQFLYSYGIKVKYLLRYYNLINHILLNHNHYRPNQNQDNNETTPLQADKDLEFLSNYWDSVFKFYPLKSKTIISYQNIIKSYNIKSIILDQLISNYKLNYNSELYHIRIKNNYLGLDFPDYQES